MNAHPVSVLLAEHRNVLDYLAGQGEVSYAAVLQTSVPKVALLAAASWLEVRTQEVMEGFFRDSSNNPHAAEFAVNAGLKRKFHTLFIWDQRNANSFFGLFGADFKEAAKSMVRADGDLQRQITAFLEIGSLRNQLVHGNYLAFRLDKSTDEIEALFVDANEFVEALPSIFDGSRLGGP